MKAGIKNAKIFILKYERENQVQVRLYKKILFKKETAFQIMKTNVLDWFNKQNLFA